MKDESIVFQVALGHQIRRLRLDREMTQEILALRGGLSDDTIRRLEKGAFSPSIVTLKKLAKGLDLRISTLLAIIEDGETNEILEFRDYLSRQKPEHVRVAISVVHNLMTELDEISSHQRDKES
ncbi:MAG: helix-turn-helix domain-containing protein [Myxococcales bacterium]|nr:helix-turn-helix domain-containing protein [Myxococcales bacterium]